MYTFNILIANAEKKLSNARMIHIMAAMCILVYGLRGFSNLPKTSLQLYTGIPAALIIIYIAIFKKESLKNLKKNQLLRIIEAVFIIMAAVHFWQFGFQLISVSFALSVLGILISIIIENQVLGGYSIKIDNKGVSRPGNMQANIIAWQDISNAMVRDNILTVDMKNNYLMQSTFTNVLQLTEVEAFNAYCKKQIENTSIETTIKN